MTRLIIILLAALCAIAHGCPNIISKSDWGARKTNCKDALNTPVPFVIIHHTTGPSCNSRASCTKLVKSFQNYHINSNKWCDIGYNFLIGNDGSIYEGRGWKTVGAHAVNYNMKSIGIAFIGDFRKQIPSQAAIKSAKSLISCGVSKKYIKQNYTLKGHRDVNKTECPGKALYDNIKTWARYGR